ncbi:MAG: 2-hydroxychromene-2-carboxylate isomerase [Dongiaceae bacterium]
MAKTVDFYHGIGSRYSYLAATQMARLQSDTGAKVRWRPLWSAALMRRCGMDPFRGKAASGQYEDAYRTTDVSRWAAFYGIPFHDPDWDELNWERLALSAVAADKLQAVVRYTLNLYDAVFGNGSPPVNDQDLGRIAEKSGIGSSQFLPLIDDAETSRRHEQNIGDAIAAGAFGVPSFVVDGQMFWGNDRLMLLRHHLGATR